MASLSLPAHLAASLLLFPAGLRRLLRSSSLYRHDPSLFRSKPWYFSDPNSNNLDLYNVDDPSLVSESFVFVFAGIAFLAEYSVIGTGVDGIGGAAYGWLGELTLLCAGSCLYLAVRPSAFFADFLLSSGLVLKGTWVLQTGLSLYTDAFGLRGCGDLKCDLDEDGLRAVAVMGFIFMVHVIVVLSLNLVVFGLSSSGEPLLEQLDSHSLLVPATELDV